MFISHVIKLSLILLAVQCCAVIVMAQDERPTPQPTPLTAPPPLRTISKEERSEIDRSGDPKQRLKITIEYSATHLTNAEKFTAESNYEAASHEVGSYHALIKNALT